MFYGKTKKNKMLFLALAFVTVLRKGDYIFLSLPLKSEAKMLAFCARSLSGARR